MNMEKKKYSSINVVILLPILIMTRLSHEYGKEKKID